MPLRQAAKVLTDETGLLLSAGETGLIVLDNKRHRGKAVGYYDLDQAASGSYRGCCAGDPLSNPHCRLLLPSYGRRGEDDDEGRRCYW